MKELTLDNFESIYRSYVLLRRYSGEWFMNRPQDLINDVRSGMLRFRGELLFTKLKELKYNHLIEKADQIINEELFHRI